MILLTALKFSHRL